MVSFDCRSLPTEAGTKALERLKEDTGRFRLIKQISYMPWLISGSGAVM